MTTLIQDTIDETLLLNSTQIVGVFRNENRQIPCTRIALIILLSSPQHPYSRNPVPLRRLSGDYPHIIPSWALLLYLSCW